MIRPPEILSLGAGVQSTALFILGCEGEVVPKIDGAIFADTRWEPRHVMEHLKNLQQYGAEHGVPVYLASRGSLPEDVVNPQVYATIPAWTQTAEYEQVPTRWGICPTCNGEAVLHHSDTDELCDDCNGQGSVPTEWERRHVRSPKGRVKRQCTPKYKIEVIQRQVRLIMKHRDPEDFADAVAFDEAPGFRNGSGMGAQRFLHEARIPLREAVERAEARKKAVGEQLLLFGQARRPQRRGCSPYGCRTMEYTPEELEDFGGAA